MQTAVSLPDGEYLARHVPDQVTEAMNVAVDRIGDAAIDPFVKHAGRRMLTSVEW